MLAEPAEAGAARLKRLRKALAVLQEEASEAPKREGRDLRRLHGSLSQGAQDLEMVRRYFRCLNRSGHFLEIGARDGLAHSNTFFLEQNASWRGVCVEANPYDFAQLTTNRPRCISLNAAATGRVGNVTMWHPAGGGSGLSGIRELHHDFARLKKETKEAGKELVSSTVIGAPLHTLAQLAGLKKINFLSIDVEGAEVAILKAFDFKALPVDVVMVECSYRAEQLQGLMDQKGFLRQARAHGDYVFLSRRATGVCGAPAPTRGGRPPASRARTRGPSRRRWRR